MNFIEYWIEFWPKLPNCTKRGFLGKLTNVTFIYILCPIMLKCFKKIYDRSWDIRLNSFGVNWAQIVFLSEKGIFWENWLIHAYLFCPIMPQCLLKILTLEQIMRYKVSQFWVKLDPNFPFPQNRVFNWLVTMYSIIILQCQRIWGCRIFGEIGQRDFWEIDYRYFYLSIVLYTKTFKLKKNL